MGLLLIRVSFTELRISCNLYGVIKEISKYPLAKILTALAYIHS